jgi:hypothetical protein
VILVNLAFAHFLSISLNMMTMNFPERWRSQLEIASDEGYIKYIHGLYLGIKTIFTVDFETFASN